MVTGAVIGCVFGAWLTCPEHLQLVRHPESQKFISVNGMMIAVLGDREHVRQSTCSLRLGRAQLAVRDSLDGQLPHAVAPNSKMAWLRTMGRVEAPNLARFVASLHVVVAMCLIS